MQPPNETQTETERLTETMQNIATPEFPFVESMPKREKGKVQNLWEAFVGYQKLVEENGPPLSFSLTAKLLGVSPQRVQQLVEAGSFKIIEAPDGTRVITSNSLIEFSKLERKSGRPTKLETLSTYQLMKAAVK